MALTTRMYWQSLLFRPRVRLAVRGAFCGYLTASFDSSAKETAKPSPKYLPRRFSTVELISRPSRLEGSTEKLGTDAVGDLAGSFSKEGLYPFALYWAEDTGICLAP
jgi:hypothetical protein